MRTRILPFQLALAAILVGVPVASCSLDPRAFPGVQTGGGGEGAGGSSGGTGGAIPTCDDQTKNGGESDVDCGQVCPEKCDDGKLCGVDADCKSGVCEQGQCFPDDCGDGVQNGDETDVDCGGPACPDCDPGKMCEEDADCKGGVCEGNVCQENCADGILNNGETDIDCGGMTECVRCDNGEKCNSGTDCTSTFCPGEDGVCCDAACDGECVACVGAKTGQSDGSCASVTVGTDPDDDCEPEDPTTCGNSDGTCNGSGSCNKQPSGTLCGDAQSCANGSQTNQDMCDGSGTCTDNGTTSCGLYKCSGAACGMSCMTGSECSLVAYCDAVGQCQSKKNNGDGCGSMNECLSGFCADGVCCDNGCTTTCQSCNLPGMGGTCSTVPKGQDPSEECTGELVCNGSTGMGACKRPDGQSCGMDSQCASGECTDGVCCNESCGGKCRSCKLAGTVGTCMNITANEDPDNECSGNEGAVCNGMGGCKKGNDGAPCGSNNECTSNFCVDGVCCDTACTGTCRACSATLKGQGADGTCGYMKSNTDPEDDCGDLFLNASLCDGDGACKAVIGTPCDAASDCLSGFCADEKCCNSGCVGLCEACDVFAHVGTCTNIPAGADPDNECPGSCNGSGMCGP